MFIVVLVTARDKTEAELIARHLVERKLCACVNIVAPVNSLFRWDNKLDSSEEAMLIIKTRKALFKKLEEAVKSVHSYEVPEIIALPVVLGSKKYLDWVKTSTV
ncbi:MAG: divalent-cation tolerance protein CutA [Candidatus Omnitrophota bacterium]|nr:divalent-cation tolerance protein CutA [Candidatus Omnitrophota bacterium]